MRSGGADMADLQAEDEREGGQPPEPSLGPQLSGWAEPASLQVHAGSSPRRAPPQPPTRHLAGNAQMGSHPRLSIEFQAPCRTACRAFIQQAFTECLLCASLCSKEYGMEQNTKILALLGKKQGQ